MRLCQTRATLEDQCRISLGEVLEQLRAETVLLDQPLGETGSFPRKHQRFAEHFGVAKGRVHLELSLRRS
jgi:hypothetical protein